MIHNEGVGAAFAVFMVRAPLTLSGQALSATVPILRPLDRLSTTANDNGYLVHAADMDCRLYNGTLMTVAVDDTGV